MGGIRKVGRVWSSVGSKPVRNTSIECSVHSKRTEGKEKDEEKTSPIL